MSDIPPFLAQLTRKLAARTASEPGEHEAIAALAWKRRDFPAASYILREGQPPIRCGFIIEGYAYRQKLAVTGEREIVSILVPGDLIDLQNLYLDQTDHDVVSLTAVALAEVAITDLRELARQRPAIAARMWRDALVEASIYREWLLNIGRRPAKARLAHLLCEFHARLRVIGRCGEMEYELPMTQEQLGDAMGLTPVHVNRVLKMLETDGLIRREKRQIKVIDWERLRAAADFNERYLHLEPSGLPTARI
ncbi:MAG: Crp/Fnr family transcriptional regulator [Sphingomonadales bacterium]|nr:MAG: Crp/Fnr family transcriptional regulator [Sphingomonadales bacterium]